MVAIRPKVDGGEHPTKCLLTLTLRSILFTIHMFILFFKKKVAKKSSLHDVAFTHSNVHNEVHPG